MFKFLQKFNSPLAAVIPLSIVGLYLRFIYRDVHALWVDEIYQAGICSEPFFTFFKNLPRHDFCCYLNGDYFLTYPFFKLFGMNKWGLAIPHIVVTILGFYILYLICKEYLRTFWGYLIVFSLYAMQGTLIISALEIRPYSVLALLSPAVFYITHKIFKAEFKLSLRKKFWIGSFFLLVFWYHPYGVMILFFITAYFCLSVAGTKLFTSFFKIMTPLYLLVFVIAFPVWYMNVFGLYHGHNWAVGKDIFQFIPNPSTNITGFLKSIFGNLMGYKQLYVLLVGLPLAFFIPNKDKYRQILFLLVLVFLPIAMILSSDLTSGYWFIQRQFIWTMPLFILLVGWSWESCLFYFLT